MSETQRDYGISKTADSPYCKIRSVDLASTQWTTGFWADRFRQCAEVTLPHLWKRLADPDSGHVLTNLRVAAGLEEGTFEGTDWQDEWLHKWMEAASVVYEATGDATLDRRMDEAIDLISQAQEQDGYVASQITATGRERFTDPHHHELYVMGHLVTAACLHHRITGKTAFLDVARRAADFVDRTIAAGDPDLSHFPINPSIIMALVELYRTTGERRYLELAGTFVSMRGSQPGGRDLNQDRVPLREEVDVVGHAVFWTYLYAGASDVYMETGEPELLQALERLWNDLTEGKLYLNGGVCALHHGQSFRSDGRPTTPVHEAAGTRYQLPSASAYNETCSQIGSAMWNWRMLAITGDVKYADLMERTFYNSVISGLGTDGASWFYTNPLRWHGRDHLLLSQDALERFQPGEPPRRQHICCPSNLLRTVAELHGYAYGLTDDGLCVNLYGGSVFDGDLSDGRHLRLVQETDYPWDGEIVFRVEDAPEGSAALSFRIPEWASGAVLKAGEKNRRPKPGTFLRLKKVWRTGEEITLSLPMRPRVIEAHPKVEEVRNHVAVERGPLVYCLESVDLPDEVAIDEVRLPKRMRWDERHDTSLLGGVTVLEGEGRRLPKGDWDGKLYRERTNRRGEPMRIRLIPYYAWANRGVSEMTVWMALG